MSATILPLRPGGREPSLAPLMQLVAPALNSVNETILSRMQSDVAVIPALAGHLISGGGKRLRPMLTLASARLLDYEGTRHHKLAAAVEFIHTATLLHDDVVDGSDQRRGKKAANLIWGNQATVLVGDFLFSRAFELMVEDGSLRVLKILSGASAIIAQGEVDQLQTQRRIDTTEERYLEVITAKTAVLFAAACQIAGVVAERGEQIEAALESFGRNLGIAFQLVDDAIDYGGDDEVMGKDAGDDFREGKLTLPVILAYKRGDAEAKRFWERTIGDETGSEHDFTEAIRRMNETGAIADTLERARHYGRLAVDAIADLPASKAKDAMAETVAFAIARAY
ncbi:MAG: polyprenyl synthetase family protein [Pacificimonas sp.]|jgi:octaprenyl-diphosphate synthase|nr:polyprenyl synthetase family protein [Pacificimonas sp.]